MGRVARRWPHSARLFHALWTGLPGREALAAATESGVPCTDMALALLYRSMSDVSPKRSLGCGETSLKERDTFVAVYTIYRHGLTMVAAGVA